MYWRRSAADFEKGKGAGNKRAIKRVVKAGKSPGLLAYRDGEPVGWCAVGPRDVYPRLENSRIFKRLDDAPVWSVTCLFIAKSHRRQGVSAELLKGAVAVARKHGARIIEGYPFEPKSDAMPPPFVWTGLVSAYVKAGFVEVARRSATRPMMRRYIGRGKAAGKG